MSSSEASFSHAQGPGLRRSHEEAREKKNRLLAILTEILKKKAFDGGAIRSLLLPDLHHPFPPAGRYRDP